jgi:hypothetical protein
MVVYKYFGRHKQWWHYGVESWQRIKFYHEQAIKDEPILKEIKNRNK